MYNAQHLQIGKIYKSILVISILMEPQASEARDDLVLRIQKEKQIFATECIADHGILATIKNIIEKPKDNRFRNHECRESSLRARVYQKILEPAYTNAQQDDLYFRELAITTEENETHQRDIFSDQVTGTGSFISISSETPQPKTPTLKNYKSTGK